MNHEQATSVLTAHDLILFVLAHSSKSSEAESTYFGEAYLFRVDGVLAFVDEGKARTRGTDCLQALLALLLDQGEVPTVTVLHSGTIAHATKSNLSSSKIAFSALQETRNTSNNEIFLH